MATLLENISEWNQKADKFSRATETKLYCPTIDETDLEGGKFNLVLGRKGSGKSALLYHLESTQNGRALFYWFPFNPNVLRVWSETDTGAALTKEQFEILWTAFILHTVCAEAARRKDARRLLRDALSLRYGVTAHQSPLKMLRWIFVRVKKIGFPYIEFEKGSAPRDAPKGLNSSEWLDDIQTSKDYVLQISRQANKPIFIFCDELDLRFEGRGDVMQFGQYVECIKGLILAVNGLREFAVENDARIFPIVAMRNDIYEQAPLPQLNALKERKLELRTDDAIENIVAHRISRSLTDITSRSLPIGEAWKKVFGDEAKGGRSLGSRAFIRDRTLNRARDYVEFLRLCAVEQRKMDSKRKTVSQEALIAAYLKFAPFLLTEFTDELCFKYDFGKSLIDVFRSLYDPRGGGDRRANFSYSEFAAACAQQGIALTDEKQRDLVRDLFRMSVLGYQERVDQQFRAAVFLHADRKAQLPPVFWTNNVAFCLHTAFRAALNRDLRA